MAASSDERMVWPRDGVAGTRLALVSAYGQDAPGLLARITVGLVGAIEERLVRSSPTGDGYEVPYIRPLSASCADLGSATHSQHLV
jgi:hypothetical protein